MSSPARPVTTLDKTEILDGLFASWEDIDRFTITKDGEGFWPAPIVQRRLHNWLVMYFHNTKKGESPSK